jgi:hypothetical protein
MIKVLYHNPHLLCFNLKETFYNFLFVCFQASLKFTFICWVTLFLDIVYHNTHMLCRQCCCNLWVLHVHLTTSLVWNWIDRSSMASHSWNSNRDPIRSLSHDISRNRTSLGLEVDNLSLLQNRNNYITHNIFQIYHCRGCEVKCETITKMQGKTLETKTT